MRIGLVLTLGLVIGGVSLLAHLGSPDVTDTGYQPKQPVPFSHKLHAGNLGMDCHQRVRKQSELLAKVRESAAADKPIPWVRVHKVPEYAYFDHQAHLTAGVSCVSCHGRIDQMKEVRQVAPLSMS